MILALAVLLVGALYWFATGGIPSDPTPTWLTAKPIAHRGLHSGDSRMPENSLAAFRAAAEAGFPLELDVHLTADGELVVFHDDDLERMTGDPRPVKDVRLAEMGELRLLGSQERIPTLGEVLGEVRGRVPVLVEIKNKGAVGKLEDSLAEELRGYNGDVAVISFNPNSLARIAKRLPDVPRGQLSGHFKDEDLALYKKFVLRHLLMNWTSKPHFIAYEIDVLPRSGVSLQRLRGRTLLGWTAKDRATRERGERLTDNVIFELDGRP